MARKTIDSVELLLRLEKQNMDQLRLEISKTEEQLSLTLQAIESLDQKIKEERQLNSTKIETGQTYTSFTDMSKKKQESYLIEMNRLKLEYNKLLDKLRDKFSDSKAYEKTIENWRLLLKKEEGRFEQKMLDDIALKRRK